MSTDTPNAALTTRIVSSAAALVAITGSIVLAGWAFDIAVLKSVLPGWVSVKANTAVCFILIGIALGLTARTSATVNPQRSILFPRLARLCVLLAGLIGLLTLGEYVFGWNLGIDQWLFREPAGMVGTSHPGRMAPETALNFVLLSVALRLANGTRKTRRTILASASLGLLVAVFALAALLSYLTPGTGAYGWFGLTLMALHTATLFAMLGMAVIAISWQPDILQWSINGRTTAAFACGIALLVFVGLNISRSQSWVLEISNRIAYSEEMVDGIGSIVLSVTDAQAETRGYVITGDERFMKSFLSAKADIHKKMDALNHIAASNPYQRQQLALIKTQANEALQWFQQGVEISRADITADARRDRIIHGEELTNRLQATFAQIENEHHQFVAQSKRQSDAVGQYSYLAIFIGIIASLLIFLDVVSRLNFAISERKRAESALRIAASAFESQDGMMVTDAHNVILRVNHAFTEITGYTAEEAVGQTPRLLKSGRQDAAFYTALWESILQTGAWHGEIWNRRKNGEVFPEQLTITAVKGGTGETIHYVASMHDITKRKAMEEKINNLAFYDPLTQIPNRRMLNDRLGQAIAASKRSGHYGALMFLDLDNFKPLNDMHGHGVGDLLLIEVAHRLTRCVREVDTVARFGGDEFVVMLSELDADKAESTAQAGIVAEKIRATLAEPYLLKIQQEGKAETTVKHHCTSSIGVVLFINHEASAGDILKWADMAMFQAKEAGRNLIRFYDPTV